MLKTPHHAAALFLAAATACSKHADSPPPRGPAITTAAVPMSVAPSPSTSSLLPLSAGDSVVDLAGSPFGPDAAAVIRSSDGHFHVVTWTPGSAASSPLVDLPRDFAPRAIASHPAARLYFVAGTIAGRSQILSIAAKKDAAPSVVFDTPRQIDRLVVGSRPFVGDSGESYRLFFASALPNGGASLRSVNEKGRIEYQVVGPKSEAVSFPDDVGPGGTTAPFGAPMSFYPIGEPMLWQDDHGCAHEFSYDRSWTTDKTVKSIPCDGSTTIAPNGAAYLHWSPGKPGVAVISDRLGASTQATQFTFLTPPVSTPDGKGLLGVIAGAAKGTTAIAYVPVDIPLGDVANVSQYPPTRCELPLFAREGGSFRDTREAQLYSLYDRANYGEGPHLPVLATTDLFWENFGAAFTGVFILVERAQAMPAFWTLVDSANAALARQAPASKWAQAFAAMADSRKPNPTGEAQHIATATGDRSEVLGGEYHFVELMPRGHYTRSDSMKQYFRAMHYFTEMNRLLKPEDMQVLASLPASVQAAAWRFIDLYRPFISPSRAPIVWTGRATPAIAPYSRHRRETPVAFPLSWGVDNEVLASTVLHLDWPENERVDRMHPSGLDLATVYGDRFARDVLSEQLKRIQNFSMTLSGIVERRPKISDASTLYERWLDALGAEWADSLRFPGAPPSSKLWDVKRLQTGLASWATLRETTILVNERADAAEAGEGGFEDLVYEKPRGYVEPAPNTFDAIANLYTSLAAQVKLMTEIEPNLRAGILARLDTSAAVTRRFGNMAERERRGETLSESDYDAIADVGGTAEHDFLIYKSLEHDDEGVAKPEPMPKIADVAGDLKLGVLEVAVGNPLQWMQIVPYFGRRQIVAGAVYSYHEFVSQDLYDNERWRKEVATHPHPTWVQPMIAQPGDACRDSAAR